MSKPNKSVVELLVDAISCADGVNEQGLVFEDTGLIKLYEKWQAHTNAESLTLDTTLQVKNSELYKLLTYARNMFKKNPSDEKGVILYDTDGLNVLSWMKKVDKITVKVNNEQFNKPQ